MRIGVIGPTQPPDCFAENIVDTLRRMGHDVRAHGSTRVNSRAREIIEVAKKALPVESLIQRKLVERVCRAEEEVIITVDASLLPEAVHRLRRGGRTKVALWFPDSVQNLRRMLMFASPYDAVFFKEPWLVRQASDLMTVATFYLPEACNSSWHRIPPDHLEKRPVVTVAGSLYPWRVNILERLIGDGVPLEVYGGSLPRWLPNSRIAAVTTGTYLAREEKAANFRSAAAVLNTFLPSEIEGVNCRVFEAAGCGAAVVTEERPVLSDLFPSGSLVVTKSYGEMRDALLRLVAAPDTGLTYGNEASRVAHGEHTYEDRLARLLEVVVD